MPLYSLGKKTFLKVRVGSCQERKGSLFILLAVNNPLNLINGRCAYI